MLRRTIQAADRNIKILLLIYLRKLTLRLVALLCGGFRSILGGGGARSSCTTIHWRHCCPWWRKMSNESVLQAWWACFRHKEMVDIEVPEKLHQESTKGEKVSSRLRNRDEEKNYRRKERQPVLQSVWDTRKIRIDPSTHVMLSSTAEQHWHSSSCLL